MTDKELGDIIKQKLEEYNPEYDPRSWDELEARLDAADGTIDDFDRSVRAALAGYTLPDDVTSNWDAMESRLDADGFEDDFDKSVRAALAGFVMPQDGSGDWDAMEQKLHAAEQETFDSTIRSSMEKFEEPYDSDSWPVLDNKIDEDDRLRRRLIVAKVLEVAAVLLIVLTVHNLMPDIKGLLFPEEIEAQSTDQAEQLADRAEISGIQSAEMTTSSTSVTESENILDASAETGLLAASAGNPQGSSETVQSTATNSQARSTSTTSDITRNSIEGLDVVTSLGVNGFELVSLENAEKCEVTPDVTESALVSVPPTVESRPMETRVRSNEMALLAPTPKPFTSRRSLKLSLAASADVNSLYMPDEQFYVGGQKIRFGERTLAALGFSTGAGLVFNYGGWSFETGLFYSSKQFEPNRVLQIGKAFDVRTLDFERISLHVIHIPLMAHWNFDRKGKTRFYAVGGAGFNLIASANYDLLTRRINSRSAPPGGGKSKTDLEVQQVKENILDGAEFSSKSYVTVSAGFGVEHYLNQKFSIFTQPTYNYQIPFFHFSDQNGKQLQNISVQFGTRMRLR